MSEPMLSLPFGTVTGTYFLVTHDGADEDDNPDVQPLNGSVKLTATVTAGRIDGALAEIKPVPLRIFGGQIVDDEDKPGARILATTTDLGVQGWAWRAEFTFETGLRVKPIVFELPAGETVSLTSGLIPVESAPYQLVQGKPGESAYEVAVRHGYTGTETQWLESLKGDGSAWDDITGKPTSYPSTVPDVQGLAARLAALEQDTGDRNITSLVPEAAGGHWTIRRIGKWVYTNLYDLGLAATSGDYWGKSGFLPVGFRPPAASQYVHFQCAQRASGFTPGPFRVDRYGGVTVYGVTGKLTAVTASWVTNDPFPSTLPGTPA